MRMTKSSSTSWKKVATATKTDATVLAPYVEELQKQKAAKDPAPAGAKEKGGKAGRKGEGKGVGPVLRSLVGNYPSVEEVRALAPPRARVHKDYANNRWRAFYVGQNISKSWLCRASKDCANEILAFVWRHHTETTGEQCPSEGFF